MNFVNYHLLFIIIMQTTAGNIIKIRSPKPKHKVIKEIANRFSPRFFSDEAIREKDLRSIFEAARLAPSARNRQPWFFYYTEKGRTAFDKLASCIPGKHSWAKQAPFYILACSVRDEESEYLMYDLGQAVISLVLQAQSLGYCARQVGNFDRQKAKNLLKLPDNHFPFVIVVLGKIGDYSKAPEEIVEMDLKPSLRKDEIARKI